jgi:hypothetical protein
VKTEIKGNGHMCDGTQSVKMNESREEGIWDNHGF